jgi:3-hydroxyisobutyrate dehydrogenase-like beta-hydroxyacid dehydrogenase
VTEADIILSILVPAQAKKAARAVAKAILETEAKPVYADCNAIAPQTTCQIDEIITESGGRFVDVGIIGNPPGKGGSPHFYASGPYVNVFEELSRFGLNVIVLDEQIGKASGIKMCYAALTKGLVALCTELLTAAEVLGVSQALKERFQSSRQSILYERMEQEIPKMPEKSRRWVGEMEEIAKTFERIGLTPKIHTGAADIYRFVGKTDLAERTPEDPTPRPSLSQIVTILTGYLPEFQKNSTKARQGH